ncbi:MULTISPECIES: hypothetical protein [unclassified Rhodosalinus]|uniref:hypothetical protein n=1 Tax=unclassified Rhodosalinus TaxID=2630183 RepID=UPI0035250DCA
MTRIFAIAALALATAATAASAMAPSSAQLRQIERHAPAGADLSVLSHSDTLRILGQISSADNAGEIRRFIRARLRDAS